MEVGGGKEASHPLTAEEEAVKRNTDCVYFLASPLTCKKGNECEYRHSEGARVNPRDCWYWMNGNCLNPKCMFRHPPLEGLYGIPSASSGTPSYNSQSLPSSTQTSAVLAAGAYNPNKQSVPCYYFQKGQCLKGDKCAFMHGPHPAGAQVPQQLSKAPTSLTGPPHALSWSLKECTTQQNIPKLSEDKLVEAPHSSAASVTKAEGAPTGLPLVKSSSPYPVEYELPRSQPHIAPVSSDSTPGRPQHYDSQPVEDHLQNGKDADEFLGESSPGFDVLVDDDIGESEYYHNDDDFGGASVHGTRNPNALNDFDYQHPDYEPVPSFERDQYNGRSDHDQYGRLHNRYGREQCQRPSERILDRISTAERRRHREESTDEMNSSDLRHRLVKQRRLNDSRSVVSPDRRGDSYRMDDRYTEDRYHRSRPSSRDRRHIPQERSSISTRLQGRITLPSRSSPDRSIELRSERDRERGKHRGRISPARPISSQGRLPERIRWRHQEDLTVDGRNIGGQPNKREDWDPLNFAGPKSLAELKGAKVSSGSEEKLTKSLDISKAEHDGLSFEGPKPFSTILKRKRESRSENGSLSSSGDENTERDAGVFGPNSANAVCSSEAVSNVVEETKVNAVDEGKEEEGLIPTEGEESLYGQSSGRDVHDEVEEGMVVETEDLELESFDPRDGQSDYEASEGEDYKAEDDENAINAYQHDNDEELDDEDDFAKKVGIMFS